LISARVAVLGWLPFCYPGCDLFSDDESGRGTFVIHLGERLATSIDSCRAHPDIALKYFWPGPG
jgi:hypothetical protein